MEKMLLNIVNILTVMRVICGSITTFLLFIMLSQVPAPECLFSVCNFESKQDHNYRGDCDHYGDDDDYGVNVYAEWIPAADIHQCLAVKSHMQSEIISRRKAVSIAMARTILLI
jgi:hypothetical protein